MGCQRLRWVSIAVLLGACGRQPPEGWLRGEPLDREDAGTPIGPAPACDELAECCEALSDPLPRETCRLVARTGDLTSCGPLLDGLVGAGVCGAFDGGVPPGDGGSQPGDAGADPDAGGAPACDALRECCPELPGALARICERTAESGAPRACELGLASAQRQGFCGGAPGPDGGPSPDGGVPPQGPECAALLECCDEVPPPLDVACRGAANTNNEGVCRQARGLAEQQGFCMGTPGPDGGVPPQGPECAALLECCDEVPPPLDVACRGAANTNNEGVCRQARGLAEQQGFCMGTPGPDGGVPPQGPECAALLECCDAIPPPLDVACRGAASTNNEGLCRQGLAIAEQQGFCMGTPGPDGGVPPQGPECASLLECCDAIPPPLDVACRGAASSNNEGICRQGLGLAQQQGFCMGTPVPDGGVPPQGPECAALAECCDEVPPPLDVACRGAASSNNEGICRQGLGLAQQQGFCMGTPGPDGGTPRPDGGRPRPDGGRPDGGTAPSGPVCDALEACCSELPRSERGRCRRTARDGDEAACQGALDDAQQSGQCAPARPDAGSAACATLGACCGELPGPLGAACEQAVQQADENFCQQALDAAQQRGFCAP